MHTTDSVTGPIQPKTILFTKTNRPAQVCTESHNKLLNGPIGPIFFSHLLNLLVLVTLFAWIDIAQWEGAKGGVNGVYP